MTLMFLRNVIYNPQKPDRDLRGAQGARDEVRMGLQWLIDLTKCQGTGRGHNKYIPLYRASTLGTIKKLRLVQ